MKALILGSGTCAPSTRRSGPATVITAGGLTILIDSASGTLRQLEQAGISYSSVDMILYTHFHVDHIAELAPYIFATKYAPTFFRKTPVKIMAAEGLVALHAGLLKAFGHWVELEQEKIVMEELPTSLPCAMQIPPLIIKACPVLHTPQSLAYRIEDETGKSIVISGDTDFTEDLISFTKSAELFICECACPENDKRAGHLTPSEAGRIASEAGVKRLVLTHFYPACDEYDAASTCCKFYDGEITVAEDFMCFEV